MRQNVQFVARTLIDRLIDHPPVQTLVRGDGVSVPLEEVDLLRASPERLERLRTQMLHVQRGSYCEAVHDAIDGVDLEGRLQGHVGDSTDTLKYDLYNTATVFGEPDAPVGIGHAHAHLIDVGGQPVEVIRASVNILPVARGLRLTNVAFARLMRSYGRDHAVAAHPRFYAGFCMSPIMYAFIHHRVRLIVPGIGERPDSLTQAVYDSLFGERVDANGVLPEHAGSRDSDRTRAWIDAHRADPAVDFYLRRNSRYADGFTLPIVVPLGLRDFVHCAANGARLELARRLPVFGARLGRGRR